MLTEAERVALPAGAPIYMWMNSGSALVLAAARHTSKTLRITPQNMSGANTMQRNTARRIGTVSCVIQISYIDHWRAPRPAAEQWGTCEDTVRDL